MCLLHTSEKRRDAGNGHDRAPTMYAGLLGHLVCDRSGDEKRAVEIHLLGLEKDGIGHVEKGVKRANAGVGDEDVDSAKCFDGFFDNLQSVEISKRQSPLGLLHHIQKEMTSSHPIRGRHVRDIARDQDRSPTCFLNTLLYL